MYNKRMECGNSFLRKCYNDNESTEIVGRHKWKVKRWEKGRLKCFLFHFQSQNGYLQPKRYKLEIIWMKPLWNRILDLYPTLAKIRYFFMVQVSTVALEPAFSAVG